jgi:hypothetical protein
MAAARANHKARPQQNEAWLQAGIINVKAFLPAFPGAASNISAVMSDGVFPNTNGQARQNYPCTDVFRNPKIWMTISRFGCPARWELRRKMRRHRSQLFAKIGSSRRNPGPICRAATHKSIKVYTQLARRWPAT